MLSSKLREYYENSPWKDSVFSWYPFEEGITYEMVMDPTDLSVEALAAYKQKLGADGRLLLVYENPFALRYWAGKRSADTGMPYDTLFGRGDHPLPSKAELQTRLKLAGFEGQKWYYPLTDHYFTREVYSENYLPDEFLNQRFVPYVGQDISLQFDERPLYREVIRGGAFEFMCGAYFVEARVHKEAPPCTVDYAAVTIYREPAKRFATTVRDDGTVYKTALHPKGKASLQRTLLNHEELLSLGVNAIQMKLVNGTLVMPRLNLPTLWDYWAKKLSDGVFDVEEMISQFDRIQEAIMKAAKNGKCYWELVPANCFYDERNDELLFIDQEYFWEDVVPEVALTRAVLSLNYSPAFSADPRRDTWLEILKTRYGITERFDWLSEQAELQTYTEVFGDGTLQLDRETEQTEKSIVKQSQIIHRYYRFLPVIAKLESMGMERPAIYGLGARGIVLKKLLDDSGLAVQTILDQSLCNVESLENNQSLGKSDVLIVSLYEGETVKSELEQKLTIPIFTLGELIGEQTK
ncbi:hypothetical protein SAMN05720606_11491 [Paenibacillus polysaccharolyticus]|uniref:Uncharacterized protein n=1 Tax=Paenibacillus polysaccharolyticus TaxID=582692 RepID=A0A1G5KDV2_9BACL|nr:hypothetical protein [Paenibacillus polysaccharolyticus]SCY98159.1 hypothetical protein SAMN05720606_11491 [Paenibacillus polysaccharolyticus]